jgi:hypothetical protein
VVERGYELVLGYEVPSLGTYNRMSDIRVGYKNISGGSWVIRRDECMAWLSEVANVCSQYTLVVDSYGWIHQGGWYATSSGEVVLDPNVK